MVGKEVQKFGKKGITAWAQVQIDFIVGKIIQLWLIGLFIVCRWGGHAYVNILIYEIFGNSTLLTNALDEFCG